MNRPAVTQAAVRRAVKAAEAMGKPVTGIRLRPDRSVEVLFGEAPPLTAGPASESDAPDEAQLADELAAWSLKHGYG
jgi:hypothetical protein